MDDIDYQFGPGAALAQLGGLAQHVVWHSEENKQLRAKHWTHVLAWNISTCALLDVDHGAELEEQRRCCDVLLQTIDIFREHIKKQNAQIEMFKRCEECQDQAIRHVCDKHCI